MKDVNALKILCELASESENEGALEVVRVQSLSLVGTAYSPLIYAIKPDISYEEFIKLIRQVHENFKKNPNMPDKIVSQAITIFYLYTYLNIYLNILLNL